MAFRFVSFRFASPIVSRKCLSLSLSLFSWKGEGGRYACSSFRRGYCGNNGDINILRRGAFSPRCKNVSPPPFLPSFLPLLLQISFGGIMRPRILLFLRPFSACIFLHLSPLLLFFCSQLIIDRASFSSFSLSKDFLCLSIARKGQLSAWKKKKFRYRIWVPMNKRKKKERRKEKSKNTENIVTGIFLGTKEGTISTISDNDVVILK